MRRHGLPGILDTPEYKGFRKTPHSFCVLLTEEISEGLLDNADGKSRDDIFKDHILSPLRQAMIDACPEFSGETLDVPAP